MKSPLQCCHRGPCLKIFAAVVLLAVNATGGRASDSSPEIIHASGPAGPYSVERWKKDWPNAPWEDGVTEGRVSVVERDGRKKFRVDYASGEIGPDKGGIGWRYPIGKCNAAEFSYTVRFPKDFEWVKGGKLPGICGGPENVSGGKRADGTNGFSARLMWRADGRGEAYVYHKNQKDKYGDSFAFPEDFRFPTETDIHVRMRVEMNDPGVKNGKLRVWIAPHGKGSEKLFVNRDDMEWRDVDTFAVDSLSFESFFGGGDKTWAPSRPAWIEIGDIKVTKD